MIARLSGILAETGEGLAIVDVGGVGYLVFCSARTLSRLPETGKSVRLEIETHVREDHIHLYGFAEAVERDWFRLLTIVQGVGAKVALAILTVLAPDALANAITAGDRAALTQAAGVGPKLAGRILSELKDKVGAAILAPAGPGVVLAGGVGGSAAEAMSALVNLGYGRAEAFGAVAAATRDLGAEAEVTALIRAGLKELAA